MFWVVFLLSNWNGANSIANHAYESKVSVRAWYCALFVNMFKWTNRVSMKLSERLTWRHFHKNNYIHTLNYEILTLSLSLLLVLCIAHCAKYDASAISRVWKRIRWFMQKNGTYKNVYICESKRPHNSYLTCVQVDLLLMMSAIHFMLCILLLYMF